MDIRSNEPYWLKKNAFKKSYPSLDRSISTEILVIGGGITGALIAYQLLKEGKEVVLVDRRDVCNGSSAVSTAMLQYEIDVPLHQLIEQRGEDVAVSSYKSCEKAIFDLGKIVKEINSKCHYEPKKSVYFTSSRRDIKMLNAEYLARKKYGFQVEWLEKDQLADLGLNARAAIISESGAVMDPYKLTYDVLKRCSKKGATIFDRTVIIDIKQKDDKMLATTAEKHVIEAHHVIHCTGYESVNTLSKKIVDLKSTYAMASEVTKDFPAALENHIFWDTSTPYSYFRGTSDKRIIVGGGDVKFKNAKARDALMNKKWDYLCKKMEESFPEVHFKPDYIWAGTFGETSDGLPYIGRPNPEINEHYVLGFGGNGITYSVMAMDAIVNSLNHQPHRYLNDYKFDR